MGKMCGVVPARPDAARSAPRQPWQSEEVDTGLRRHAASVLRLAALVEGIDLQPAVVGGEAGRPVVGLAFAAGRSGRDHGTGPPTRTGPPNPGPRSLGEAGTFRMAHAA